MQLIITIYALQSMMILKLGIRFVTRQMLIELNEIVNPTLKERIDESIVAKLINAKDNFWLGAPIKILKKS